MQEPYVHKIYTNDTERHNAFPLKKHGFLDETAYSEQNADLLDKAIFAYPIKHYANQDGETGLSTDSIGKRGENFAVLEMDEFTVFIGDTFQMGEAIIQVSQPGPVSTKQLQNGLHTGWYFRVLREGEIQQEKDLVLLERPNPQWSVAACIEVMFLQKDDLKAAEDLYACQHLGEIWKRTLRKRLQGY